VQNERVRLEERAPKLADEERVALGQRMNRRRQLVQLGVLLPAGGAQHEVGDLVFAETAELDPHDVVGPP
jgi:hypothetical protein